VRSRSGRQSESPHVPRRADLARAVRSVAPPSATRPAGPRTTPRCACGGGCPRCQAASETPNRLRLDVGPLPSGQPLDARLDARLSAGFSAPVSGVRLHTDARAARLADALDAEAFTAGSHIFFAADRSPDDLSLLAHETAHALQQPAGVPRGWLPLGRPESVDERAADEAASAVLAGRSASIGATAPMHIARKGRGVLGWAWDKLEDPGQFLEDVVEHPIDATVGDAGDAFVEGVKADVGDVADLGSAGLDAMRGNAALIRKTGDAAEAWLVKNQKEGAAGAYADADAHSDSPVLGPLLHANAWLADQSGQIMYEGRSQPRACPGLRKARAPCCRSRGSVLRADRHARGRRQSSRTGSSGALLFSGS